MKDTTAARKYARALFTEALAKNQIQACLQALDQVTRLMRLQTSLSPILSHPFILVEEKKKLIHSLLKEREAPLVEEFLDLLVEKERIPLLAAIAREFQEEVDRHEKVQPLRVRAAFALSEAQRKRLQTRMEAWLSSKVRMELEVDPRLIGGLLIQTRDGQIDQSLRGKLRQMRQQLTS
jgi:F-type H+-transporting ATPase subunit delta